MEEQEKVNALLESLKGLTYQEAKYYLMQALERLAGCAIVKG